MAPSSPPSGQFANGMFYRRFGHGPRPLVIVQGLTFENSARTPQMLGMYRFLGEDYTVYSVLRRPNLPRGTSLADMAADYAALIRAELGAEFGGPIDVIGVSTGGSIAQHLAADHPDVVRRLVIHSSAHTLSPSARQLQLDVAHLAQQGRWADAYYTLIAPMLSSGVAGWFLRPLTWLVTRLMALGAPKSANDLAVTVEAEDRHAFLSRLGEITAPTLVVAGTRDPFYTPELFRETAAGLPNGRLILYEGMGHPATGKRFQQDVLAFLREGREAAMGAGV